jgi:ligand-binding sensor domain-containing protein
VLSLAADGDRVYAGLPTGVAEFRNGAFHRMRADGAFATAVHTAGDRLDVGTLDQGIFGDAAVTSGPIRQFHRSGETAWAIGGGSVYARSGARGQWKAVAEPQPAMLADHNIAALAVDPSGTAWIGYFDRGMDVLPPSGNAQHIEDEHVFCVNRIVPTSQGAVIATANGLVMADAAGHPRRVLTRNDGLIANHVTDVVVRPEGLIAATSAGITYVTPQGAESIYAFHGLVNNHVYCLGARGNQLIAGTLGGISLLDNRIVGASFTTANSALRANWISALTAVGDEWFAGTYGAGVFRYDGAGWHDFPSLREPFEVNPNAMAATAQAVYAGTLSRGLAVYNRANGRWAFHTAGLPSLNVTAVAAHDGWIWIGTANGLVRLGEGSVALP